MVYLIIGKPGTGKSTEAAGQVRDNLKRGLKTYTNLRFDGAYYIDTDSLGLYRFSPGSTVIIDEGGILFNNRGFATFEERLVFYFKMSRHYGCDVYIYSQEIDVDKKIRDICEAMYLMSKTCVPMIQIVDRRHLSPLDLSKYKRQKKRDRVNRRNEWLLNHGIKKRLILNPRYCLFVHKRRIKKDIYFNKEEHTVSDGYELCSRGLIQKIFFPKDYITRFAPPLWKHFNSFAMPDLPLMEDKPWSNELEIEVLSNMLKKAIEADEAKKRKPIKKSENTDKKINIKKDSDNISKSQLTPLEIEFNRLKAINNKLPKAIQKDDNHILKVAEHNLDKRVIEEFNRLRAGDIK